jgi:hypothetical protein
MNDAAARKLAQVLKFNGSALLEDRASLQRLLAPGATEPPAEMRALLLLLDTKAVAHLIQWARLPDANKPTYAQMREHIAAKYEQAGKLPAATAAWALDAWAAALPELQRAQAQTPRDMALEEMAPPPAPPPVPLPTALPAASAGTPVPTPAVAAAPYDARRANPYAPPTSHVEDVPEQAAVASQFVDNGRAVAIGRGWGWIVDGWRLFVRQPVMWWLTLIVFFIVTIVIQIIPIIGPIIGWLLGPVFFAGLLLGAHAIHQGEQLTVGHIFAGFQARTGSLILLALLQLLAFIAAGALLWLMFSGNLATLMMTAAAGKPPSFSMINSMIGLVLVSIVLFLPLSIVYYFAPGLVAIDEQGPLSAYKSAFIACFKNILPGIVYLVLISIAAVLASIPFFLGWLVLLPVMFASIFAAYQDIFHVADDAPLPSARGGKPVKRLARTLTPASNVPAPPAPAAR